MWLIIIKAQIVILCARRPLNLTLNHTNPASPPAIQNSHNETKQFSTKIKYCIAFWNLLR